MAKYRTISVNFWSDPYVEELTPSEKLLYLYLFSNPYVNNVGGFSVSTRKIKLETGISDVERCCKKFVSDGKLVMHEGYFWVVNFIKNQTTNSPKILKNIADTLDGVPPRIGATILETYKYLDIPYQYPINTLSIPYKTGLDTLSETENTLSGNGIGNGIGKGKGKKLSSVFLESEYREEAYKFADWFNQELRPSGIPFKRDDWAMVYDLLRRIDGYTKDQIKKAAKFGRTDSFWSKNFRSPLKLRDKNKDGEAYISVLLRGSEKEGSEQGTAYEYKPLN